MNTSSDACDRDKTDLTAEIRGALQHIEDVDQHSDRYLSTLAFILQRVAAADDDVSEPEVHLMERILVEHASLTPPEAVLTVEMAKQRCCASDCGRAYDASRRLRDRLEPSERARLRRFLDAVAAADGRVRQPELDKVRQIAAELGLAGDDATST